MKKIFRKIFSPILNIFESGSEPYAYKPSHRFVLLFIGILFSALGSAVLWFALGQEVTYLLPAFIFAGIGLVCLIIAAIGNDRAVAKIWGSR